MIITISGLAGSGKSTVAKKLAVELRGEWIYVGGIRRELARQRGLSIQELNEYAKTHPETDVDIDKKTARQAQELEQQGKIVVVEGRTQFHFLPNSIKVFMKVSPVEAAQRIWNDLQDKTRKKERNEGAFNSLAELKQWLIQRDEEDALRYKKYYHLDHRKESHYDLVVDTTNITPEEAIEKVLRFVKSIRKE